jgi:hypothetical protein
MWIAAKFGFLMPAIRPPDTVALGDQRSLQIRSRRAMDLDRLRAMYMLGKLGPTLHTPDMDYQYRAYCTPESFAFAVAQMVMGIDYKKFKPETLKFHDNPLHSFYNSVWSDLLAAFPGGSYDHHSYGTTHYPAASRSAVVTRTVGAKPNPKPGKRGNGGRSGVVLDKYPETTTWSKPGDQRSSNAWVNKTAPALPAYQSGYGRDELEPEVSAGTSKGSESTGDAILDDLFARIDYLEYLLTDPSAPKATHKYCTHPFSDAEDSKCEEEGVERDRKDLEALHTEVAQRYQQIREKKYGNVAQSSGSTTVGDGEGISSSTVKEPA